jgi:hypothetical protein
MNRAHALTTRVLITAGFVWLSIAAACRHTQPRPLSSPAQGPWAQDSARYATVLTKWVRDSVVRDSISRTINTDSLYRLYHRMLHAADPVPVLFRVTCEADRLLWTYGGIPGTAALKRMSDTLYAPDEVEAAKQVMLRLQRMSPQELATTGTSPARCGGWGPRHPNFVDGTALDAMTDRPRPPRHP